MKSLNVVYCSSQPIVVIMLLTVFFQQMLPQMEGLGQKFSGAAHMAAQKCGRVFLCFFATHNFGQLRIIRSYLAYLCMEIE